MLYDVTIGIPLYRSADYIRQTMQSALAQTFGSIEFLVVDDCGGDGSYEAVVMLCREHPRGRHIRLLQNSGNHGVGETRNRIIGEAAGRYLYFLDSDDTIEPDTIRRLYDAASRHQAEVAYASYEIVDWPGSSHRELYKKDDKCLVGEGLLADYAFGNVGVFHVSACNCLIDLQFLRRTGVRFISASYWEDMAFTYELVPRVSRAVLLSDVTYHYLRHPGSLSNYEPRREMAKEEILMNAATVDYLKAKCSGYRGKSFLPSMCYNLELNSFYMVCHVLRNADRITPAFTWRELRAIVRHPLRLTDVVRLRSKLPQNLLFWVLGRLPVALFGPSLRLLGRIKGAI